MDLQNVKNLTIPEGSVKTIHDKNNQLLWGAVGYNTTYQGDTTQETLSGKNLQPLFADGTISGAQTATSGPMTIGQFYTSYSGIMTFTNGTMRGEPTGTTIWKYTMTGLQPETTYTISCDYKVDLSQTGNFFVLGNFITNKPIGISTGRVSHTFTTDVNGEYIITANTNGLCYFYVYTNSFELANFQLELRSSSTSFEPYCGGIPAPNPGYPEPVNVVTGTQNVTLSDGTISEDFTVDLTSKNLFNGVFVQGTYYNSTLVNRIITSQSPLLESGQPYTISFASLPSGFRYAVNLSSTPIYAGSGGTLSYDSAWKTDTFTFTPSSSSYFAIVMSKTDNSDITPADVSGMTWQLEKGSPATSYQSYFDYELCKISQYQDYIYKNGDIWYIHKNTGKIIYKGTENWTLRTNKSHTFQVTAPTTLRGGFCNYFSQISASSFDTSPGIFLTTTNTTIVSYPDMADVTAFKSWLSLHNTIVYYGTTDVTDIQITDATLISQLNTIHDWLTRYGYSATVTGNLPLIIDRTNL